MKTRKAFLYGFLMLAFITLLSGIVQSNNRVAETTHIYALDNSPPAMLPIFDLNVNITCPAITWLCRSMPGLRIETSTVIYDNTIFVDVQSTNYINLSKLSKCYYATEIRQKEAINNNNSLIWENCFIKSPKIWIYDTASLNKRSNSDKFKRPRDGLRQSWQNVTV